jgi:hypothetical protein
MNLDAEARLRNSEIIWRELLGATPFRPDDVKDPFGLADKFWTPDRALAHLREKFSWTTMRLLKEFSASAYHAPEELVSALLGELNLLIEGPCLYDKRHFADVELPDEAQRLLNGTTEELEKPRLNRLLLETLCWPAVARSNGYAQNFNILVRRARLLLAGKAIRGEIDGEAHFTPEDVAEGVIARLAEGRPLWEPERSKLMTFAWMFMRSYVDHELNRSDNKLVESISRTPRSQDDDGPPTEDETRFSDGGRGRRAAEFAAEFANLMENFPADSLERKFWEAVGRGKGNEKLPELAVALGVGVGELRKARANVERVLTQLNYFNKPPANPRRGGPRPDQERGTD